MAYGNGSTYGHEDDPSYGPDSIGDPIKLDPLAGINEKRPKFRSRKQQQRAEQYAAALGEDASSTAPLGHWTQMVGQWGKGILAGLEEREIDQSDATRRDYLAAALEGDQSAEDLMRQGIEGDVPELTEFGQYKERRADRQGELDWRHQTYETEQDWKRKQFGLEQDKFDFAKSQPAEGSVPKISDVTSMRKEIQDMPSAKRYSAAIPVYNSMLKAGPGRPGDLQIVYALAKIMDPDSVVREGEQIMVKKAQGLGPELIGYINGLNGGAELLPETRKKLFEEAKTRAEAYKQDYDYNVKPYLDIAASYKIDPRYIIPEFAPYGTIPASVEFGD